MTYDMTIAAELARHSTAEPSSCDRAVEAAELRKASGAECAACALIAPLAIFLLLIFVVPIGALLTRAAQNPEVVNALPHTVPALRGWDRKTPRPMPRTPRSRRPGRDRRDSDRMGALARRLNMEIPGYRSLVAKTARAMPFTGRRRQAARLAAQIRRRSSNSTNAGATSPTGRRSRRTRSAIRRSICWRRSITAGRLRPHRPGRSGSVDLPQHLRPHLRDRRWP